MTVAELLTIAQLQSGTTSRCERYRRRLDEHLKMLPNDTLRLAFIKRELANWNDRYRVWAERVDAGNYPEGLDQPNAWDFTETIADLDKCRAKLKRILETGAGTA